VMWPTIAMCASLARSGELRTRVCRRLPSQALRITGESVFPSRARTLITWANSGSRTSSRLSFGAPVSCWLSQTSAISPSPLESPDATRSSVKLGSIRARSDCKWSQELPLRPFLDAPTRTTNSLG
jgi:hypothetical protein